MIKTGHKLLAVHRRLYDEDASRYFLGTVVGYDDGIACVRGHTWVVDPFLEAVFCKDDERCKYIGLGSSGYIVYRLPDEVDLDKAHLTWEPDGSVWLVDDGDFRMDLAERPKRRA